MTILNWSLIKFCNKMQLTTAGKLPPKIKRPLFLEMNTLPNSKFQLRIDFGYSSHVSHVQYHDYLLCMQSSRNVPIMGQKTSFPFLYRISVKHFSASKAENTSLKYGTCTYVFYDVMMVVGPNLFLQGQLRIVQNSTSKPFFLTGDTTFLYQILLTHNGFYHLIVISKK